MSSQKAFKVKVVNADTVLIDAEAASLTAQNREGKFDILPDHQPFITLLQAGDVLIRKTDRQLETVTITQGVLRFADNNAVILVNIDVK